VNFFVNCDCNICITAAKWQKKGKAQAKDKSSLPEDAWIKRLYGSSMYHTIKTTTKSTAQNWLWMSDKGTERVIIHIDLGILFYCYATLIFFDNSILQT